jgi:hypothetical protein
MIWFNEEKDLGAVRTDDGVRLEVPGSAFPRGGKPVGRCGGRPVELDVAAGLVSAISLVEEIAPRRARLHRR